MAIILPSSACILGIIGAEPVSNYIVLGETSFCVLLSTTWFILFNMQTCQRDYVTTPKKGSFRFVIFRKRIIPTFKLPMPLTCPRNYPQCSQKFELFPKIRIDGDFFYEFNYHPPMDYCDQSSLLSKMISCIVAVIGDYGTRRTSWDQQSRLLE